MNVLKKNPQTDIMIQCKSNYKNTSYFSWLLCCRSHFYCSILPITNMRFLLSRSLYIYNDKHLSPSDDYTVYKPGDPGCM